MKRPFKPNATHLALALVLIGLRPAIAAAPSPDAEIGRRGARAVSLPKGEPEPREAAGEAGPRRTTA